MFEKIIQFSIEKRLLVVLAAILLLAVGTYVAMNMPVDVFPDLTAPTVTILADAHGMAPEEVETLVVFPVESAVNGATNVRRVRSWLATGIAVIWVEFEWGTDIFLARQIIAEKLQSIQSALPPDMEPPILAPVSSIMGEIMLIAATSDSLPMMEVRSYADNQLRRRLMGLSGVAQVVSIGGEVKQYQVLARPERMAAYDISWDELRDAVSNASLNTAGGFFHRGGMEILVRSVGRAQTLDDLRRSVVALRGGSPVLIEQVADVEIGAATPLGSASHNGHDAVLLSIQKQPGANTLELTQRIDRLMDELRPALPLGLKLDAHVFRQADFIEVAITNVQHALRDGAMLVLIILLVFLGNFRTTVISLVSIPLSLVTAVIVMKWLNITVNTMTLGGMAIAVGVIVDDAIIDVENVFRRLRQNFHRDPAERDHANTIIFRASSEIRRPMVMATVIIIAVFLPLFFLAGIEGRLLIPLGFAFVISVFASLLVALTVVPALCAYLLPPSLKRTQHTDTWLVRKLKTWYRPTLQWAMNHANWILLVCVLLVIVSGLAYWRLGRSFLPEFNEGSATLITVTAPGTSLKESTEISQMIENILLRHPAVESVARRTGRGELDEHASSAANSGEIEVRFKAGDFDKEQVFHELRDQLAAVPGTNINLGQPISHRIDHILSGTQAALAVKIFGPNLYELRRLAAEVEAQMKNVDGIVDLSGEPQSDVPQLHIKYDREALALHGLQIADVAEDVEAALNGETVGQILEGQIPYDLVVRLPAAERSDEIAIRSVLFSSPRGVHLPLEELANIQHTVGANTISRENVQRKIVVQANIAGRDLKSTVEDVRKSIADNVKLPAGYFVTFGGQFESAESAGKLIVLLSLLSLLAIFVLLFTEFGTFRDAILVMINLPLALIGGIFSIYFTGGIITVAALVGFVTLFGIAARNGILLIEQYRHHVDNGLSVHDAIMKGSLERMNPILMTALCAGLALIPLALGGGQPGKEIQAPMAIVILGGLLTSTALNMVVLPALYARFGCVRMSKQEAAHE